MLDHELSYGLSNGFDRVRATAQATAQATVARIWEKPENREFVSVIAAFLFAIMVLSRLTRR